MSTSESKPNEGLEITHPRNEDRRYAPPSADQHTSPAPKGYSDGHMRLLDTIAALAFLIIFLGPLISAAFAPSN